MKIRAWIIVAVLVAGVIAVAGGYFAWQLAFGPLAPASPEGDSASRKPATLTEKRLSQLERENARLAAEVARLKNAVTPPTTGAAESAAASVPAPAPATESNTSSNAAPLAVLGKLVNAGVKQQIDVKLAGLKVRLNLND